MIKVRTKKQMDKARGQDVLVVEPVSSELVRHVTGDDERPPEALRYAGVELEIARLQATADKLASRVARTRRGRLVLRLAARLPLPK